MLQDVWSRPLTVVELTRHVKRLLDTDDLLADIVVRGEVSNFKHHTSGHMYFSLKDESCVVRCVMFRREAQRLVVRPENGMDVLARGAVSVYERDGQYQLYVQELRPAGVGALQRAFEELKRRLELEGLFDPTRKRRPPVLPRRVGVVTSPTGAALRDIIQVSRRRFPNVDLVLAPVLVQGPEAPDRIVAAIERLNRSGLVDVIIVGRGGGSLEDLWAFNDERVARAIFASRVPVVSGVGHETDVTISDLVADVRAATPSHAAELVVPSRRDLASRLDDLRSLAASRMLGQVDRARQRLAQLAGRPALGRPADRLRQWQQQVDDFHRRAGLGFVRLFEAKRNRRDLLVRQLDALSPLGILARGYVIARKLPDGSVLRSARALAPRDRVELLFRDGEARCRVQSVRPRVLAGTGEARRAGGDGAGGDGAGGGVVSGAGDAGSGGDPVPG